MRVLFYYFYGNGGAIENFYNLILAFANRSSCNELILVCDESSKLNELIKLSNVTIIHPPKLKYKEISRLYMGLYGIKGLCKKYNPDLVWCLNLGSYQKLSIPIVLSLNNAHQVYPFSYTSSHPGNKLRVALLRAFFRRSYSVSNLLITQTKTIANHAQKINTNKAIAIIPKVAEIHVNEYPLEQNLHHKIKNLRGVKLLYVASNYAHKNHKVIIEALYQLNKNNNIYSLILSITEEEAYSICGNISKILIEQGSLVCLGWLEKNSLKNIYDLVDICLMPSKLESLSSSHLEAMSWSVPQIVSDYPFARETCGDAALYASADSTNEWICCINTLANNKDMQKVLISNGHKQLNKYPKSWEDMACKLESQFSQLVKKNKQSS